MTLERTTPVASVDRADILGMLRRRGWILAVGLLLGLAAGAAASSFIPRSYTSTATVQVFPIGLPSGSNGSTLAQSQAPLNLDTEAQVAVSLPVATIAAKTANDTRPVATILQHLAVTVASNTTVLSFTITDPEGARAQALANAFAAAYIQQRNASAAQTITDEINGLTPQKASLAKQLSAASGQLALLNNKDPDHALAAANVQILTSQMASIDYDLLRLNGALFAAQKGSGASQLAEASPATAVLPIPADVLALASGAALGLALGALVMLFVQSRDHRLHRGVDVERLVGVPLLGQIAPPGRKETDRLMGQGFGEARNEIAVRLPEGRSIVLLVPVDPGTPAGEAACNLGASFAASGDDVVLVCADLTSRSACDLLGVDPERPGLADALRGTSLPDPVPSSRFQGLSVVPPGSRAATSVHLLQARRMTEVAAELRVDNSIVIVEAPPARDSADAQTMARFADAVVLVVRLGRTSRDDLAEAVAQFERVGAPLLGVIGMPSRTPTYRPGPRPAAPAQRPETEARTLDSHTVVVHANGQPAPTVVPNGQPVASGAANGASHGVPGPAANGQPASTRADARGGTEPVGPGSR